MSNISEHASRVNAQSATPGRVSQSSPLEIVLGALRALSVKVRKNGAGYTFKCPAHNDKAASASLKVYADGVGLKCFTGCTTDAICGALGIQKADLFRTTGVGVRGSRILRTYQYFDAGGQLLCQHHRMMQRDRRDPKFLWQRFDESGHAIWSLGHGWFELCGQNWRRIKKGAGGKDADHDDPQSSPKVNARWFDDAPPRPLYHLVRLKDAAPGSLVLWNEGEKDTETAECWGFLATTAGGAQDWQARYADDLAGFDLVIIADNDHAGRVHAAAVARDCLGKAARVRVIECLPGVKEKGDLSDWAEMGNTRADLLVAIEAAPDFTADAAPIEDESTAVHVEPDDAPLSDDPKIDQRVRRIAFNAAKVNKAISLIMRNLGFKADHARLLTNLSSIKPGHLGTLVCVLQWLADEYGMSVDTVSRDIQKLLEEQRQLGVEVLTYTPGTMNPATGQGYGSKFRRGYLRLALRAVAVAIESQGDLEYSHDALKRACEEVARQVPRVEAEARVNDPDDRAEKRADGEINLDAIKFKHKAKLAALLKRRLAAMGLDGLTLEDALELMSECVNDATVWAATHTEGMTADDAAALVKGDDADHIEMEGETSPLSLNTEESTPQHRPGDAAPYSPQDADHMAETPAGVSTFPLASEDFQSQDAADPEPSAPLFERRAGAPAVEVPRVHPLARIGRAAPCDYCGLPMPYRVSNCPSCGAQYTASWWRVNHPEVEAPDGERFYASD